MSIVAGIDVGSLTAKAVVMEGNEILVGACIQSGARMKNAGNEVLNQALEEAKIKFDQLKSIVATGYGRVTIPFAQKTITEIACHAAGIHFLFPNARTIIDIGGQDSKCMKLDEEGNVVEFAMNDKCAAGTGRFLDVMANALEVGIEELGTYSLQAKAPCKITSMCTIFAESEVISLLVGGEDKSDIIAGLHKAIMKRTAALCSRVGIEPELVFTGGVAKNEGMAKIMGEDLDIPIKIPEEPQLTGALGAAIHAGLELEKEKTSA